MSNPPSQLVEVGAELSLGEEPTASVRELISWFGAKRRGVYVNQVVRTALESLGLVTIPEFETAYIDELVRFAFPAALELELPVLGTVDAGPPIERFEDPDEAVIRVLVSGAVEDPTYRIGQLTSANRKPVSIAPDAELRQATTLMMINDFSQLPVMTNERDVKGVISWASIGRRIALGKCHTSVRDCMETHLSEVPANFSVLSAIDLIVTHGFVLVRQPDRRISGIVTTADLSLEFRDLAEPFLLVGEIENSLRRLINNRFSPSQISGSVDPEGGKTITSVADLTFGDFVYLLQDPANWVQLGLTIDRATFIARLNRIREIRNEVMHFNPDPFDPEDLTTLRASVTFLRELVQALVFPNVVTPTHP